MTAKEVGEAAIERSIGDIAAEYESEEALSAAIKEEAYTLALDAILDAGFPVEEAMVAAALIAANY